MVKRSLDMNKADLPYLSVTELGRLIKTKEVSPVEATEAYLDRIDDLDFKFNAYLTVCRHEAMEAAKVAEQAILRGNYVGPMHGIPVGVKDQIWSKGIRTTGGSRILADLVPDKDATALAKLKEAGAILLGKMNLAMGAPHSFSTPRNPWNLDRSTGGSSSGSGAAVAAFLCGTSLGEDTGGSIRRPACWCGVVGLRPSWGRVSRYGLMPLAWSMDTVGPISRTVEDAAITLGAIAGYDPKDPYTWDTPVPDYRSVLDGNVKGLRVGTVTEMIKSDLVEVEVREAVVKATSVLGELGAKAEEVSLPITTHGGTITGVLLATESAATQRRWIGCRLQDYGRTSRVNLLTGSIMPAQAYYKAQQLRSLVRRQVLEALEKYDVLILPTAGTTAPSIEEHRVITSKEMASRVEYVHTRPFNLAGAPAISVSCGFSSDGLPIGLQIGGRPFEEETVLKVAHAYEQNTSWHTTRPPTV